MPEFVIFQLACNQNIPHGRHLLQEHGSLRGAGCVAHRRLSRMRPCWGLRFECTSLGQSASETLACKALHRPCKISNVVSNLLSPAVAWICITEPWHRPWHDAYYCQRYASLSHAENCLKQNSSLVMSYLCTKKLGSWCAMCCILHTVGAGLWDPT